MDGIYREMLALIPPGANVLDLGCGLGLLGMLLAARGLGNETYGIEWDPTKAHFAKSLAGQAQSFQVVRGDLLSEPWPECSVIVLLDVLHYFRQDQQTALLIRTAEHLPEGGRLLLRVMDSEAKGVAAVTRFCERTAVGLGWNHASRVHWRPLEATRKDAREAGFSILSLPGEAASSIGNRLLIAEKLSGSHWGRPRGFPISTKAPAE